MKIRKSQPTLALKPTQFSVGMLEVEYKVLEIRKLSDKKRLKLVRKTPIPVVVSPWKELCIVDHHHFVFACWHANIRAVRVRVVKDYSNSRLTYHKFWQRMRKRHHSYPFDQFGDGPRSALYLPLDIRGMADDPYRSLAWMVRHEGGYRNSTKTFAEFAWADLFRRKRLLETEGRRGFHPALKRGLRVARSEEAKGLPGYVGTRGTPDQTARQKKKSVYVSKERKTGAVATRIRTK